jgi:uncharacterized cupin superfamily protein
MRRYNLNQPEFADDETDPEGFKTAYERIAPKVGGDKLGATHYLIRPGQHLCPYHYEYAEEEWLLVLEGRPTLRDPEGAHELEQWDLVFFTTGPDGAHQIRNDTDETARVLMYSELKHPGATVYPDSDKIAVWTGNRADDLIAARSSAVDYFHGET